MDLKSQVDYKDGNTISGGTCIVADQGIALERAIERASEAKTIFTKAWMCYTETYERMQ